MSPNLRPIENITKAFLIPFKIFKTFNGFKFDQTEFKTKGPTECFLFSIVS